MLSKKFRFLSKLLSVTADWLLRRGLKIQLKLKRNGAPPHQKTRVDFSVNNDSEDYSYCINDE